MKTDHIVAVGMDNAGCLYVQPQAATFPLIYREAMDVHWDGGRNAIHSPPPREHLDFTLPQWFKQILNAAKEQGCVPTVSENTKWLAVPEEVKREMLELCANK